MSASPGPDSSKYGKSRPEDGRKEPCIHGLQLFTVRKRQRAQQDGVDDGEDGGVRSYAERQRQDGRRREGWPPPQRPGCIAEVLPEIGEHVPGRGPWRDGLGRVRLSQRREVSREQIPVSEAGERQLRRLVLRYPTRHQFSPPVLEVLRELLDDLALARRRQAQRRETGADVRLPIRLARLV